ncbi:MAG TPA: bifunctional DNA-formamidopyrimidine glycosylase/DNA-(apurinic or apyrimidinic site) lyase [Trebonia sp.]|nr:bifunctional DNA-formamidopyrimidine glycosylase/DNA-(apurinic or apyrimidinic site) lyase [Trebonia sp.]
MPELPEVETVRAGLERHVVGRTVADVQVLHPRVVRRDLAGSAGFAAAMAGRTVKRAERRGKYLWLALDDDEALLAHLGMSGQLLVGDPDRPLSPHVRARFTFTDGGADLRFTDQRTFGHLMLCPLGGSDPPQTPPAHGGTDSRAWGAPSPPYPPGRPPVSPLVPAPIAHIAPDPMEAAFDDGDFAARLTRRHTGVKRALLDQSLISGVGNIYADEALWHARLHWARPTETLKRGEVSRLLEAVREVLSEALRAGGTSFDTLYVNVNGESGYFDRSLQAYGREGEPCSRCGTPIRRDAFMNRSSYSCPHCQPRPRRARP